MSAAPAPRLLPELNDLNRPYWTGGADGRLLILRDRRSGLLVHPPETVEGEAADFEAVAVSGKGTLFSFTINYQPYRPEVPVPYVIGIVELDEQQHLRLPTNIVNCAPDDVQIGMRVRVVFEQHGDIFVPLFEPDV